jgi:hypothetical protein
MNKRLTLHKERICHPLEQKIKAGVKARSKNNKNTILSIHQIYLKDQIDNQ